MVCYNECIHHENFFRVSRIETDLTGYRPKLFNEFIKKYPNLNVIAQNIANRKAAIIRRNLIIITQENVDRIREEVSADPHEAPPIESETELDSCEEIKAL
jgi:hypothetical protein